MRGTMHRLLKSAAAVVVALLLASAPASAAPKLDGRWVLTITIPESPTSNARRTLTVTLDVSPRGDSLNGRLTATDDSNRTVSGAWRQVGKQVSITYEMPCPDDGSAACGSLVLLGKLKGDAIRKGRVIVMWDTPNNNNPALYDTANGTFNGERLP
ncbi:MAG TPA: hypothetical protein VKA60_27195 [Blastocatellia bacterium]|nr:hypothetical protein [Blastocatellia bacterium]